MSVTVLIAIAAFLALLGLAIAFGGPGSPPPLASFNDDFSVVDFSDLPQVHHYQGKDGASLAYRPYIPERAPRGSVVLVHGSSFDSRNMHVVGKAFAKAGYSAYALDVRGHGESGGKGDISYIGQLEDDVASFVQHVAPPAPTTLVGFSAGGGFALRFAGGPHQDTFQSYVLLSPVLGRGAPTNRPDLASWARAGVPRLVAVMFLNKFGIGMWNDLCVVRFALNDENKKLLTPVYSYSLAANFGPHEDWRSDVKAVRRPCGVLAGTKDEVFFTEKLEPLFRSLGKSWPVTLLPGINHMGVTFESQAVAATVSTVEALQAQGV